MDSTDGPMESIPVGVRGSRAAIAGLVFSGLYVASYVAVRDLPQATWSDKDILAYHASADVDYLKLVTLYLVPFAGRLCGRSSCSVTRSSSCSRCEQRRSS